MHGTVELQWLEHLSNHENMFKTGVVLANECFHQFSLPAEIFHNLLLPARTAVHGTVELQWLEHLSNHENMFKTGVVLANEC